MKLYLFIIQSFYVLTLMPWFIIWGLSFMAFDSGVSMWGVALVTIVTLYPLAVVISSVLSWLLKKKVKTLGLILISSFPLLWVISFAVLILGN
ncbi:apolipoprotein N-acyltransferase [Paenibacillus amylolyticus]|uniref:Apolipoprotein N-acyltransferase n=1 Tax=Paenibacillus amylolyticus TaxID=1451 RepID=A0AAP5LPJ0_PAEAM|nr:apolipoprotein N-acyltransferase [Paenibacillus amylolyticus]